MDEIKGETVYGGELEFFPTERFSFAFGAEYYRNKPSASIDSSGNIEGYPVSVNLKLDGEFSLIPLLGTARFNLPYEGVRVYAGLGAGYYMGKIKFTESFSFIGPGESGGYEYESESKGSSLIPHINGGFDFNITENISICADIRYPLGKIKSFEIKKSTEPEEVGKKLTYEDVNGVEKDFKWELSGFNLGIFLRIKF